MKQKHTFFMLIERLVLRELVYSKHKIRIWGLKALCHAASSYFLFLFFPSFFK